MVHARILVPKFTSLCKKISTTNLNIYNLVPSPDICFWDTLIRVHCEKSEINKCFLVFKRMTRDRYTFPFLIEACTNALALREEGRISHGLSMLYGVEGDMFARSSLIDCYGNREDIKCAGKVFDGLRCVTAESLNFGDLLKAKCLLDEMPVKSLATWNAMIKGLVRFGELKSARILFDEMPKRNKVSFTTMIDGYAKVGDMVAARWLFDELPEKDLFSCSALISGYLQNGEPFEVVIVFLNMWSMNVKPDDFIMESMMSDCSQLGFADLDIAFSLILEVCMDLGLVEYGCRYFYSMINEYSLSPSPRHYECMVNLLVKSGKLRAAYDLIESIPVVPHVRCWGALLGACELYCEPDFAELIGWELVNLIRSRPVEPDFRDRDILLWACMDLDTNFFQEMRWQLMELEDHGSDPFLLFNIYGEASHWFELKGALDYYKDYY